MSLERPTDRPYDLVLILLWSFEIWKKKKYEKEATTKLPVRGSWMKAEEREEDLLL